MDEKPRIRAVRSVRWTDGKKNGKPDLDMKAIFRQMIANELRDGRLTAARRRRIVRYAAHLKLSAVETGKLISKCREEALDCDDPAVRAFALRLVPPEQPLLPGYVKVIGAVVAAAALNWALVAVLW